MLSHGSDPSLIWSGPSCGARPRSAAARLGGGGPDTGMNRKGDAKQATSFPQESASNLSTATSWFLSDSLNIRGRGTGRTRGRRSWRRSCGRRGACRGGSSPSGISARPFTAACISGRPRRRGARCWCARPTGECRKVRGCCHFKPRHRQFRDSTAPHFAALSDSTDQLGQRPHIAGSAVVQHFVSSLAGLVPEPGLVETTRGRHFKCVDDQELVQDLHRVVLHAFAQPGSWLRLRAGAFWHGEHCAAPEAVNSRHRDRAVQSGRGTAHFIGHMLLPFFSPQSGSVRVPLAGIAARIHGCTHRVACFLAAHSRATCKSPSSRNLP